MKIKLHTIFIAFVLSVAVSCSVKKYIPEDEFLYTGADLELKTEAEVEDLEAIEEELEGLLRPAPNSKILGMYLGLWAHYKGTQENPGFINRFLNKKIGQEPVYFSQVDPGRTEELLINRLENRGFFYSTSSSEVIRSDQSAKVQYVAEFGEPYTLSEFKLERDSLQIEHEIAGLLEETLIKENSRFDLNTLNQERNRLDSALKEKGYFNFNNDFLIFEADTNLSDSLRKFNLYLRLKQNVPANGIIPYQIDEINVYPNYSINEDGEKLDTTVIAEKNFIQGNEVFRPTLLNEYILLEKDQLYSPQKSRLTSNRLSSIGTYKFVNVRYEEQDSSGTQGHLKTDIYLSPMTKRSVRAELLGVSKSNNFAGPALNLTYRNRNLFQGGETFNLTTRFGYEFQVAGGDRSGLESFEVGLNGDLIFPRVIFFVPIREKFSYAVPKTKIGLGLEYLSRGGLYRLNSFSANYGYFWNPNPFVYHEINPISLNVVNLTRTSPEFEEILDANPFLRRSFEQNFIAGINYTFHYNKLQDKYRKHAIFAGTTIDLAGNTLNLINSISGSDNGEFLGLEYAQYAKADLDFRYYFRPNEQHTIATRLYMGAGFPFGNSVSLPYVKQYFSGGPNSVRAFRIRSIGPGTYRPEGFDNSSFFDQSGDIRFEGNIEYRFPIVSFLKGALFMDAGNIWLMNENEALPGGKFTKNWYKELAIGTGIGLRVDIQFFVIRFDFATPLRYPYLEEGERWANNFDIGSKTWRRDNLIFNFAIGYPF
ncbi:BamA/TamA family outer membrane protein [Algoriphagus halophytocola]|uniref:BamA/TamA family outer membrane protein n=1 Tax=Algoriphagus halophytocola TaxID=2991499 RepID=A0ABY6MKX6_9BACT|nr:MULTISPECIES: BamA/TamA family outer membrane protein [unclassified Algoriphagus]UZD24420.1 BamA/TamA family outer membrane protein [Algoriphagus sp. TR-M5]WBL41784.1 BamA/TamA family outer membrane protein [Algoriphagus sp. TR-M9]